MKLVSWGAPDESPGRPLAGASFVSWPKAAPEGHGHVWHSPPNGIIRFVHLGGMYGPIPRRFRCAKPGYEPIEGKWDVARAGRGNRVNQILLITMKRAGEAP